jgi:hypothetical protein
MAAPAGVLVFGKQYRPVDIGTAFGPSEQIGVGGTGFGDDLELTPRHAAPDQPVAQGRHVQRRPIYGVGCHDAVLFSSSGVIECAFWASTVR